MVCHSRAANWVLGLTQLQMNRDHDYGSTSLNQLVAWEQLGLFHINAQEHLDALKQKGKHFAATLDKSFQAPMMGLAKGMEHLPAPLPALRSDLGHLLAGPRAWLGKQVRGPLDWVEAGWRQTPRFTSVLLHPPEGYRRLVNPLGPSADLDARARSYLHANCSQCHVEAGGGNAKLDLEFTTARGKTNLFGERPMHDTFGIANSRIIDPGHPERSVLLQRLTRRGPGQMPPLASSVVDRDGVQLLQEWIKQMKQ
jgi:hypothetical protein